MYSIHPPPPPTPAATPPTLQGEEGLCQLVALLWLEDQQAGGYKNAYEERLAAFLGHQIRWVLGLG